MNIITCVHTDNTNGQTKAGRSSPAVLVLAGPVFLKVKIKSYFYKKQVISRSASVIFGHFRFIILSYVY